MRTTRKILALLAAAPLAAACSDEGIGPDPERVFVQIERLGNPLVSEVTLAKRNHGFHNTTGPTTDVANFTTELEGFITGVAGREQGLADGYGGRNLTDDVVDAGLAAIFGSLLNANNVSPGLSTDNVDANDKALGTAFPYLAAPTTN